MSNIIPIKQKTFNILIIDDDPEVYQILIEYIGAIDQDKKYVFFKITDPRLSINSIKEKKPDLILLDYDMPYMNGIDVMKKIYSLPKRIRPIVVFLTNMPEHRNEALKCGAEDYIEKSDTSLTNLFNKIKNILNNSKGNPILFGKRVVDLLTEEPLIDNFEKKISPDVIHSEWLLINGNQINSINWNNLLEKRIILLSNKEGEIFNQPSQLLWVSNLSSKPGLWVLSSKYKKAEQLMLVPVSVSPNGDGIWLTIVLDIVISDKQKLDLEEIIPRLTKVWEKPIQAFYDYHILCTKNAEILKKAINKIQNKLILNEENNLTVIKKSLNELTLMVENLSEEKAFLENKD